jgi:hypothetical protein
MNVYKLSIWIKEEEEITYPSPPPITTIITTITTTINLSRPSSSWPPQKKHKHKHKHKQKKQKNKIKPKKKEGKPWKKKQ